MFSDRQLEGNAAVRLAKGRGRYKTQGVKSESFGLIGYTYARILTRCLPRPIASPDEEGPSR